METKIISKTTVFITGASGYSSKYLHTIGRLLAKTIPERGAHIQLFDGCTLFFYTKEFILCTKVTELLYGDQNGIRFDES